MFVFKMMFGAVFAFVIMHFSTALLYTEYFYNPKLVFYIFNNFEFYNLPLLLKVSYSIAMLMFFLFFFVKIRPMNLYGFSKYATKKDIKKFKLLANSGIFMGEYVKVDKKDTRDEKLYKRTHKTLMMDEPLSVGIIAPPGTGKTSTVIIPTLFKSKSSFIVSDPKGELFEKTAPTRSLFSKIIRFDPMQAHGKGAVFNPFSEELIPKDRRYVFAYVKKIANLLIADNEKGDDSFFTTNARIMFTFVAAYLVHKNNQTSIPEIASHILSSKNVPLLFAEMVDELSQLENDDFISAIIKQGNAALSSSDAQDTWGSIMTTATSILEPFTTDALLREATDGKNEIDILKFKKSIHTLYIVIPDEYKLVLYPLVRLLFEVTSSKLISVSEDNKAEQVGNKRVTFLIDEFPRLGKMKEVLTLPSISRGMGVSLVIVAQDMTQIEEIYGEKQAQGLFSLFSYWYLFSQNDMKTAKKFSEQIGNYTNKKENVSYDTKNLWFDLKSSKSFSYESLPLVSPSEILASSDDFGWVLSSKNPTRPIRVKNYKWYNDEKMLKSNKKYEYLLELL